MNTRTNFFQTLTATVAALFASALLVVTAVGPVTAQSAATQAPLTQVA